uniref:Uncharacterized protein n=1 Tax=Geladintestivirus 3 TaxID=3233135 RepID=A0AAU8MHH4_9CAUD
MSTKRNNNEVKEFAVGTKIEYNGKLYEVVKSNTCEDCSIKNICSNIDKGNTISDVLSEDKRNSIFGKCSSIIRSDGESIVFVEVSTINGRDVYSINPLYKTNNDYELMSIEINVPNGYVIDKENSDLSKGIIRFKNKWLTVEELYKLLKEHNHNIFYNFSNNNKLVAIANLINIASYFNGSWEYDVTKENVGYMIAYDKFVPEPRYSIRKNDSTVDVYYGNPIFKNEDDAKYVISNPNFRTILDKIFKV